MNGLFRLELDTPIIRIKRLIGDEKGQIELSDMLDKSVRESYNRLLDNNFDRGMREIIYRATGYRTGRFSILELVFENIQNTLELFANLTLYGSPKQEKYIEKALKEWARPSNTQFGESEWHLLPVALLVYVCGILAVL